MVSGYETGASIPASASPCLGRFPGQRGTFDTASVALDAEVLRIIFEEREFVLDALVAVWAIGFAAVAGAVHREVVTVVGDTNVHYAKIGVGHHWLVDRDTRTVTAYRLESGRWSELGVFGDERDARIEPFTEITIDVASWWT